MTRSSTKRKTRKVLGDLVGDVPEDTDFSTVTNSLYDALQLAAHGWAQSIGKEQAALNKVHSLSVLVARNLLVASDPLLGLDHFRTMVLTQMHGAIPEFEEITGKSQQELADKLLLAGALVTSQKQ